MLMSLCREGNDEQKRTKRKFTLFATFHCNSIFQKNLIFLVIFSISIFDRIVQSRWESLRFFYLFLSTGETLNPSHNWFRNAINAILNSTCNCVIWYFFSTSFDRPVLTTNCFTTFPRPYAPLADVMLHLHDLFSTKSGIEYWMVMNITSIPWILLAICHLILSEKQRSFYNARPD